MRLFITASRSIALTIVDALPGTRYRADDHFEIGDNVVTWCDGRLLELCEPDFYDSRWAKWDATTLPIKVPYDKWQLTPKLDKNTKKVDPAVKKKLAAIEGFLKKASVVVNAGDSKSEAPMLIGDVIDYFGYRGKVMYLQRQSKAFVSAEEIEASMQDNSTYQNVRQSELCRSRANWLIGKNMTRAATKLLARDQLISIGRIQTPMLAMIVRRCIAVESKAAILRNYYTERTLIREMQLYARCGISDIAVLKARGFVETYGGQIKDTALGRSLVLALPEQLTDMAVAAAWENALEQVAKGDYPPEEFMRRIDIFVDKRLDEIKALAGKIVIRQDTPELQSHPKTKSSPRVHTSNKPTTSMKGPHFAKPSH